MLGARLACTVPMGKSDCSDGEGMSKDNVTVGFVGLGTMGGRDSRSVMLLQQERAGVEIAVDPERLREARAPAASKENAKPA